MMLRLVLQAVPHVLALWKLVIVVHRIVRRRTQRRTVGFVVGNHDEEIIIVIFLEEIYRPIRTLVSICEVGAEPRFETRVEIS